MRRHVRRAAVVSALIAAPAVAQALPTATQCKSATYARTDPTGQALAAAADASWSQSVCLTACTTGAFSTASCNDEAFYNSICGHIEAARLRERTRSALQGSRCASTMQAQAPAYAAQMTAGAPTSVLAPEGGVAVAVGESASGAVTDALVTAYPIAYGRQHATVQSLDASLDGRAARLASEAGTPRPAGAPQSPMLAERATWTDTKVKSCEEFVWQRTYSFSAAEDEVARRAGNPLSQAQALYATTAAGALQPYAVLARAIREPNAVVRSTSGIVYEGPSGATYRLADLSSGSRDKNALVALPVSNVPQWPVQVPSIVPRVITLDGLRPANRRYVAIDRIGLTDSSLVAEIVAARAVRFGNSAQDNQLWLDHTVATPGEGERRMRIARLKDDAIEWATRRAAVQQAFIQEVMSHAVTVDGFPIHVPPEAEEDTNPIFDPGTVMFDPYAQQLAASASLIAGVTPAFDAGALFGSGVPVAHAYMPGGSVSLEDYLASPAGRAMLQRYGDEFSAIDETLEAVLQQARDEGCFRQDLPFNLCDWDPASFVAQVRRNIRIDRNGEYAECTRALGTADFLVSNGDGTWSAKAGTELARANTEGFTYQAVTANCTYEERVVTVEPETLQWINGATFALPTTCDAKAGAGYALYEHFLHQLLRCKKAKADLEAEAASQIAECGRVSESRIEAAGIDWSRATGVIRQAAGGANGSFGGGFDEGNDLFRARLAFSNGWSIGGFRTQDAANRNTACALAPQMTNTFEASGTILGFRKAIVAATANVAATGSGANRALSYATSSLTVMGQELAAPANTLANVQNVVVDRLSPGGANLANMSATFVVGFVPITVAGGLTGQVGVDWQRGGGAPSCQDGHMMLVNRLSPHAQLDAYAAASVNLAIVEAGVKGVVTLLGLRMDLGGELASAGAQLRIDNAVKQVMTALSGYLAAFVEVDYWIDSVYFEFPLFAWNGITVAETLHADRADGISVVGLRTLAQ